MRFENLLESLLLEGKIDDINNQFPHIPSEVKTNILNRMPNPKSPDVNHYQWLLKQHSLGNLNDSHDIHDILSKFSKNKTTLKKPKLNQYSSIDELHQAVNGLESASVSKKQQAAKDTTVLYSSPTMIVRQHHSHKSCIEAAKLPNSNLVKSTVKSVEGEQIGKANWCVSADSTDGLDNYYEYTKRGKNPVYSIDTIYPDGSTRRHIYVTNNSLFNPEFRNETQDNREYDLNFRKFAKDVPEIMKTPIAHHFDDEHRKLMHLNDFLNGDIDDISSFYNYSNVRQQTNTPYMNELIKNPATHTIFSRQAAVLQPHHIDELIKNPATHVNLSLQPQFLQPHHIDELVKNPATHETFINALHLLKYPNPRSILKTMTMPHHIDELIKNPDNHFSISQVPDLLQPHHIDELIKNPDKKVIVNLSERVQFLQPHHIDELIKNPDSHAGLSYRLDNLQPHHIDELIKKSDDHAAISHRLKLLKSQYKDKLNNTKPSILQQFHNKYKLTEGFLNSNFEKLFIQEIGGSK